MADAELGVVIKTEGAEEGAASLDKFSASAHGAAEATNDLSSAQSKVRGAFGIGGLGSGLSTSVSEIKKVDQAVTATGKSVGFLESIWQGMRSEFSRGFNWESGFGLFSRGATEATKGITGLTGATGGLATAVHALYPAFNIASGRMGDFRSVSSLLHTGIVGLAAGITGVLVVALEKAADTARLARNSLETLLGKEIGGNVFDQTRAAADSAGASITDFTRNVALASQAIEQTRRAGQGGLSWVGPPGEAERSVELTNTLAKVYEVTGKTATEAQKLITEFWNSVRQNGGVTLDMFKRLETEAPLLAKAIADGMLGGTSGIGTLQKRFEDAEQAFIKLGKAGKPAVLDLGNTISQLVKHGDEIAQAAAKWQLTFSQAFDKAKNSLFAFFGALGEQQNVAGPGTFFESFSKFMNDWTDQLRKGTFTWKAFIADIGGKIAPPPLAEILPDWQTIWSAIKNGFEETWNEIVARQNQHAQDLNESAKKAWDWVKDLHSKTREVEMTFDEMAQKNAEALAKFDAAGSKAAGDLTSQLLATGKSMKSVADAAAAAGEEMLKTWGQVGDAASSAAKAANTAGRFVTPPGAEAFTPQGKPPSTESLVAPFREADNQIRMIWIDLIDYISTDFSQITISTDLVAPFQAIVPEVQNVLTQVAQIAQSIVTQTAMAVIQIAQQAMSAVAQMRASGGGGGGSGGPSFDASQVNTDMMANFATGGAFQVLGPGGTDSVPVRFMATPGEIVTVTPNNLTSPAPLAGMTEANLQGTTFEQGAGGATSAAPARAITEPITFAVRDGSGKIVGAVDNATAAINAMATSVKAAATSGGGAVGGTGGRPIYTYHGKAGSAAGPLGSGPIDAYGNIVPATQQVYITRINYNSAIAGMPQGPGQPVYAINPNYVGGFAEGGSFIARAGLTSGTDSALYSMRLTPGEKVTVQPANDTWPSMMDSGTIATFKQLYDAIKTRRTSSLTSFDSGAIPTFQQLLDSIKAMRASSQAVAPTYQEMKQIFASAKSGRPIVINVYGAQNPMAFIASEASIKRSVRRAMA